jgi:PBP1b-binding outer membrane lipoprotein LpoB
MKKMAMILMVASVIVVTGCSDKYKKGEKQMKQPINCATAEGDIRLLMHEKAHVSDQIESGVTAIVPAGAVIGIVTKTEGTKLKVATGEYNKMIDKRIAEIKAQCGVK